MVVGTLSPKDFNLKMEPYLFYGKILPERAQISLSFGLSFSHFTSGDTGKAEVSIVLNQLSVIVHTEKEWDIFDLRNVVRHIVQTNLAMIGYLKGYAYDLEITRVLNSALGIDYVFGIDIPVIAKSRESIDLANELEKLKVKTAGENGIFLNRCFNDLVSAMKNADDTGFYCYRAIEALRHHCAAVHKISEKDKKTQWEKFREVSKLDEQIIRKLEASARPIRHGEVSGVTDKDREELFKTTWEVVGAYIANI
jgi:hypothetical protein